LPAAPSLLKRTNESARPAVPRALEAVRAPRPLLWVLVLELALGDLFEGHGQVVLRPGFHQRRRRLLEADPLAQLMVIVVDLTRSLGRHDHEGVAGVDIVEELVDAGPDVQLPTQITLQVARVEINGEVGRNFIKHGYGDWIGGLSTEVRASSRLELLAELQPDLGVSEVSQAGALEALRTCGDQLARRVAAIREERPRLTAALRTRDFEVSDSQANFLWAAHAHVRGSELSMRLAQAGVLVAAMTETSRRTRSPANEVRRP